MTAIVILNWNGAEMMRRYLPSVLEHSEGAEIVVADNASTDHSMQVLHNEFPTVRIITLSENYGFAEGYNCALRKYEEENRSNNSPLPDYYVLLNSDVRTPEKWLSPLTEYMDAHYDTAACQPKLLSDVRPTHFEYAGGCGGYIDKYGYPYCRGRIFDTVEEDKGQYDDVADVMWATGACLMIRREDYWKTGGLDGRFFAHNEEIDLCWRLNIRGRRIVCVPQSCVYHLGGGTLPQGNPRKTYLNFRNNLTMLYKNLPQSSLRRVMFMRCLLDYVAALQMALKGQWGDVKAILRARCDFRRWQKDFEADRNSVLQSASKNQYSNLSPFSILWQYYVCRKRRFNEL